MLLKPHLSFCIVERQLVFLDLAADRYFMLAERDRALMLEMLGRENQAPSNQQQARLVELGLVATPAMNGIPLVPAAADPVVHEHRVPPGTSIGPLTLAATIRRVWSVSRALRRGQFARLVATHRSRQGTLAGSPSRDRLAHALGQFSTARQLTPTAPNCLVDSLALCSFLAVRGHPATLVVGVRLTPFRAHAWVQHEAALLNDDRERIAPFTPILTA